MDEVICDGEIRGAFFFQQASIDRAYNIKANAPLFLEREPYNAKDSNAIIVRDFADNLPIGYMAAEKAAIIAPLMDAGNLVLAKIKYEAMPTMYPPRPIFVAWIDNTSEQESVTQHEEVPA